MSIQYHSEFVWFENMEELNLHMQVSAGQWVTGVSNETRKPQKATVWRAPIFSI